MQPASTLLALLGIVLDPNVEVGIGCTAMTGTNTETCSAEWLVFQASCRPDSGSKHPPDLEEIL